MAKWKEILSNSAVPDDFVVTVKVNGKDETLSIGEMRAYDRENEGALTQRLTAKEKEVAARESNLNTASIEFGKLVERVADQSGMSVDDLLAGKAPTRRAVAQSSGMDENDPLVGTLVKEIKSLRAELKGEIDTVKKQALGPMLNTYLEDFYEASWDKLSPSIPKGAKVTRDEALKYATENGYKDSKGRLDLSKAIRDLTYDARVNEAAESKAQELRKKIDDERVLAAAPKPSGTHLSQKPDKSLLNSKGQVKSLDEALLDAAGDSDLWRGISGNA